VLHCLADLADPYFTSDMRTLTVRLSETLVAEIEAESRDRKISKSDVVREKLERARRRSPRTPRSLAAIADLIGSVVDELPADLSARTKHYLRTTGCESGRRLPGRRCRPAHDR